MTRKENLEKYLEHMKEAKSQRTKELSDLETQTQEERDRKLSKKEEL